MGSLKVCVALGGMDNAAAIEAMRAAARDGADVAEIRLDTMPGFDLGALLAARPLPVIVTYRPMRAGGAYVGPEAERVATLRRALAMGAEHVDVEPDALHLVRGAGAGKLIVSHHDFEGMSRPLLSLYRRLAGLGADIVKLAVTAERIEDNLEVFEVLRQADRPTIALAMGEAGLISRILAGRYGAYLTFAAPDGMEGTAPGQVALSDMLAMYRVRDISTETALYGVIANPVGHSLSPAIHNAAFQHRRLDAVYLPLLVEEPVSFLRHFVPLGFRGFSVTIPHKQAVIPALDDVEPLARRIGAVNTVVVRDARLAGYNTDAEGAVKSIEEALPPGGTLAGMRALLVGAGGLARALAYALGDKGVRLTVANRGLERGRGLAAELGAAYVPLEEMPGVEADLVLQTTSVGMHPRVEQSVVPAAMLRPGMIVYDAVYNPLETRLLREAKAAACITVSGLGHFVNQAARQFELWTGQEAPRDLMRQVMLERLAR